MFVVHIDLTRYLQYGLIKHVMLTKKYLYILMIGIMMSPDFVLVTLCFVTRFCGGICDVLSIVCVTCTRT